MMIFAFRALALVLVVIAHGFGLAIGQSSSAGIAVVYAASIIALVVAAILLWRKTMALEAQ